jgi:hypothetical protein
MKIKLENMDEFLKKSEFLLNFWNNDTISIIHIKFTCGFKKRNIIISKFKNKM